MRTLTTLVVFATIIIVISAAASHNQNNKKHHRAKKHRDQTKAYQRYYNRPCRICKERCYDGCLIYNVCTASAHKPAKGPPSSPQDKLQSILFARELDNPTKDNNGSVRASHQRPTSTASPQDNQDDDVGCCECSCAEGSQDGDDVEVKSTEPVADEGVFQPIPVPDDDDDTERRKCSVDDSYPKKNEGEKKINLKASI